MLQRFVNWFAARSPRAQFLYGTFLSVIVATLLLYCLGLASFIARPFLLTNTDASNLVPLTTPTDSLATSPETSPNLPTLTPLPRLTMPLPQTTLRATPTQAPVPTRVPPSDTPTPTATNPNSTEPTTTGEVTISPQTPTATKARTATATFTPVARP